MGSSYLINSNRLENNQSINNNVLIYYTEKPRLIVHISHVQYILLLHYP